MPSVPATPSVAQMAVFTRNHAGHLEAAADACAEDPSRLVTFRSRVRWASAAAAIRKVGSIPVYFALVDGGPEVRFTANIVRVQLDPDPADPKSQELLSFRAGRTRDEPLKPEVMTLYAIANCHALGVPFRFTELLKYRDGLPIDENYQRAYVVVRARAPQLK